VIGVAHQRVVRERLSTSEHTPLGLTLPVNIADAEIKQVPFTSARDLIKKYEWLGTMPSGFRVAYGIFWEIYCGGVVVFGSPNPMQIAKSVFGGKWTDEVMQLHRGACVWWAHEHAASFLIGGALKRLSQDNKWRAVVAFADPAAGEIGTVYQATNWTYCGWTAKRPDYFDESGRRMVGNFQTAGLTRRPRPRKRRYLHLLGNRRLRAESKKQLKWEEFPYDKRLPA